MGSLPVQVVACLLDRAVVHLLGQVVGYRLAQEVECPPDQMVACLLAPGVDCQLGQVVDYQPGLAEVSLPVREVGYRRDQAEECPRAPHRI